MNGQITIVFGHALILTLKNVKSIERHALVMVKISAQGVNVRRTIMVAGVSIGMSAHQIKIVVYKVVVLIWAEHHYRENSVTVNLDGLDLVAVKVNIISLSWCFVFCFCNFRKLKNISFCG